MARSKYCSWPPKVIKVEDLGYVEDSNGRCYPRDIGCSTSVNDDLAIIQFGDTFVHSQRGKFLGVSCANAAIVTDKTKPQICTYTDILPNGMIPVNPPLLKSDTDNKSYRTSTWCFGGIVFPVLGKQGPIVKGYTYCQVSWINKNKWEEIILRTSLASVSFDTSTYKITMARTSEDDELFNFKEPKFGTFSAYLHGHYVYAYGHASESKDVMLARVPAINIRDKSHYEFFDGKTYQSDIERCNPVITNMQHGSIYRSKLFKPNSGKDWVFIGCSTFGDCTVQIGVAPNPEGPWSILNLITAPLKTPQPDSSFTYCMYAHPWAYREENGELMITWSEGGIRGKVVAVKVQLSQATELNEVETCLVEKILSTLKFL